MLGCRPQLGSTIPGVAARSNVGMSCTAKCRNLVNESAIIHRRKHTKVWTLIARLSARPPTRGSADHIATFHCMKWHRVKSCLAICVHPCAAPRCTSGTMGDKIWPPPFVSRAQECCSYTTRTVASNTVWIDKRKCRRAKEEPIGGRHGTAASSTVRARDAWKSAPDLLPSPEITRAS